MQRFHGDLNEQQSDIGFVGDVIEFVGDTAESIGDGLVDVVKAIPGGEWIIDGVGTVTGPIGDFAKGPLRDFAKTGVGEVVFRAFSVTVGNMLYMVPVVGFSLGFLAWSIPGLAKGERIDAALVKEFAYRVEYVASIFAGKVGGEVAKSTVGKQMSEQLVKATQTLKAEADKAGINIQQLASSANITPTKLAAQLGIRPDVAAYAIAWAKGASEEYIAKIGKMYDPETGKPVQTFGKVVQNTGKLSPCEALKRAKASKASPAIIKALEAKCKASMKSAMISAPSVALARTPLTAPIQTLAAKAAVTQAVQATEPDVQNQQLQDSAVQAVDSSSTKKSIIAGVAGTLVGTGGALLAGLSTTIAAPVGLGFGAGSAIVTKLLTRAKK